MAVFEIQLAAADEPGESTRLRASERHQAGVAGVGGQPLAGKVEGPIPEHVHVLVGDEHDAMEVEREEADRQLDDTTDRRYVADDVLYGADQQAGEQIVVSEAHRHALLVEAGPPGYPPGHALVVPPHRRTGVIRLARKAHERELRAR